MDGGRSARSGDPPDDEPLEGRYANYVRVGHNAFEFLLDFGQFYSEGREPEGREPLMHTRIVTSPTYAKVFLDTIRDSIAQYEATFGPIEG